MRDCLDVGGLAALHEDALVDAVDSLGEAPDAAAALACAFDGARR